MHTYNSDGSPKGAGISISNKTANGWSVPQDVKIDNYYNKGGSNEFCMSADRKVFLFAIKRDDTYGDNDLYVSFLKDNGEYTEPKNLGSTVNTSAWEISPFLAADGVTLYFGSPGHPGYGSTDIFVTKRLDSTWTKWSEPQNMGPDINSSSWDAYFSIPASGNYAYVVSDKESIGGIDIFRIKLPNALKPKPVVLVYGKVLNSKTNEPVDANIAYNILSTNKEVGIAISNIKDGSYKIVLPADEVYSFLAKKENFYSVAENIDLKNITEYKEIERNLYLAPIEIGETIRLNNLFFDFNKSNIRTESFAELDRILKLLNDNPNMTVEIAGHTDNVGTDAYNLKLSGDRANAVKTYLLGKGIAAERISSKGYGKSKPCVPNTTEEGRQKNRRVEFTILKK
jgi:outer membrane protein OmpA-like peptidoglycan-associated protein